MRSFILVASGAVVGLACAVLLFPGGDENRSVEEPEGGTQIVAEKPDSDTPLIEVSEETEQASMVVSVDRNEETAALAWDLRRTLRSNDVSRAIISLANEASHPAEVRILNNYARRFRDREKRGPGFEPERGTVYKALFEGVSVEEVEHGGEVYAAAWSAVIEELGGNGEHVEANLNGLIEEQLLVTQETIEQAKVAAGFTNGFSRRNYPEGTISGQNHMEYNQRASTECAVLYDQFLAELTRLVGDDVVARLDEYLTAKVPED